MAKKKYTLEQFYNESLAILEKYQIKIMPGQRFSVDVLLAFNQEKGTETTFEIWFSNGLDGDAKKIVTANERNPKLSLMAFETDLMDTFNVGLDMDDNEIQI